MIIKKRESRMENNHTASSRRLALKSMLGATAAVAALPRQWQKPLINAVILPAHAQTSACPLIVIGNVTSGPQSGTNDPALCRVTFDVLSDDPTQSLDIISITNSALADDVAITYNGFGEATDTDGPRVIWAGPASDAPFCVDFTINDDVTFTVTATCDVANGQNFQQEFLLSEILIS